MTDIIVCGITGRMGQEVVRTIEQSSDYRLVGAVARKPTQISYKNVSVFDSLEKALQGANRPVIIDFTTADSAIEHLVIATKYNIPMIIGVTGFTNEQQTKIYAAAKDTPVLVAENFSEGAPVLHLIAGQAAAILSGHDISLMEIHHRDKREQVSGTMLRLQAIVDTALAKVLPKMKSGQRKKITAINLRAGSTAGEHRVLISGTGETLELIHRVDDRSCFARGALKAAYWLQEQRPGKLYAFGDVIAPKERYH